MEEYMNDEFQNDEVVNDEVKFWQPPAESYYTDLPTPTPKPKKNRTGLKVAALALCFSLVGSVLGTAGVLTLTRARGRDEAQQLQNDSGNSATEPTKGNTTILEGDRGNTVIDINKIDTSKLMTAAEVYAANVHSTVGITTSITSSNFWGQQTTSAASGSGFIISNDGYILTNFHVIDDASKVTVSAYDGKSYDAKIVGYDESNDIAVLKVEAEGLSPVVLGDSENLNVGDSVVAIGNPLGELTFTLTTGVISAKDREITFSDGMTMNLLQTDCAINSGNSGGALFNLYGEVIGVTNAKYSSSSGGEASIDNIGFAIPMNSIRSIVESIIEKGYVSKPHMGVTVSNVSESYQIYGLPAGAAVQSVEAGSPAEVAGVKVGDIITKANDKDITCASDLTRFVEESQVGDSVQLAVYRKGQTLTITVEIGEQIQSANSGSSNQSGNTQQPQRPSGW